MCEPKVKYGASVVFGPGRMWTRSFPRFVHCRTLLLGVANSTLLLPYRHIIVPEASYRVTASGFPCTRNTSSA